MKHDVEWTADLKVILVLKVSGVKGERTKLIQKLAKPLRVGRNLRLNCKTWSDH